MQHNKPTEEQHLERLREWWRVGTALAMATAAMIDQIEARQRTAAFVKEGTDHAA